MESRGSLKIITVKDREPTSPTLWKQTTPWLTNRVHRQQNWNSYLKGFQLALRIVTGRQLVQGMRGCGPCICFSLSWSHSQLVRSILLDFLLLFLGISIRIENGISLSWGGLQPPFSDDWDKGFKDKVYHISNQLLYQHGHREVRLSNEPSATPSLPH